jgi:hypothetical protein
MLNTNEEILNAIVSLQGNPNWETIFSWIKGSRDSAVRALYENTVFNGGRVSEIQDMIDKINSARGKLEQAKVK